MLDPKTLALSAAVIAGAAGAAVAEGSLIGAAVYHQYCATCHGAGGEGDGPLTEHMLTKVPDLTAMAAENDGVFPMLDVIHVIDGRTGLRGHGGPMPVYGSIFMSEKQDEIGLVASVLETRGRILSLALYLESIQD